MTPKAVLEGQGVRDVFEMDVIRMRVCRPKPSPGEGQHVVPGALRYHWGHYTILGCFPGL
jgi:hypothetical protein